MNCLTCRNKEDIQFYFKENSNNCYSTKLSKSEQAQSDKSINFTDSYFQDLQRKENLKSTGKPSETITLDEFSEFNTAELFKKSKKKLPVNNNATIEMFLTKIHLQEKEKEKKNKARAIYQFRN